MIKSSLLKAVLALANWELIVWRLREVNAQHSCGDKRGVSYRTITDNVALY
jgi:hypothetical protein